MEIKAYKNNLKLNVVNKSLENESTLSCNLLDPCDILNPVIIIDYVSNFTKNYFYIPDFNRYYYLAKPAEIDGKTMILTLHCDVLMSWKSDIYSSIGTATRSNFYNSGIPDKMYMALPSESIQYRKLSDAIEGGQYVMIVGGK